MDGKRRWYGPGKIIPASRKLDAELRRYAREHHGKDLEGGTSTVQDVHDDAFRSIKTVGKAFGKKVVSFHKKRGAIIIRFSFGGVFRGYVKYNFKLIC